MPASASEHKWPSGCPSLNGCSPTQTFDFVCQNTDTLHYTARATQHFHRINDCLLSMIAMLSEVNRSGPAGSVCIVVQSSVAWPFLPPLLAGMDAANGTVGNLRSVHWSSGLERCRNASGSSGNLIARAQPSFRRVRRYPPTHMSGMRTMWDLVRSRLEEASGSQRAHILVAIRTGTRDAVAMLATLKEAMRQRGVRRAVRFYFGNETQLETLHLFGAASSLIHVHGAAFANAAFIPDRSCVHEITTFATLNSTEVIWRSNGFYVTAWSPLIRLALHYVPLAELLRSNNRSFDKTASREQDRWDRLHSTNDRLIKGFAHFPIAGKVLHRLGRAVLACDAVWCVEGRDAAPGTVRFDPLWTPLPDSPRTSLGYPSLPNGKQRLPNVGFSPRKFLTANASGAFEATVLDVARFNPW